ncbi:response regulator transcription factor [Kineosporia succinea]|uniref:Two-component system OmpR family response regulator n=1 Tax=Kineosporia succinea TaxID=84632 RepID=A0ABT9PC31_9ACTN|nr:response regulator transcription factor [Kineosporia succinea]MDP9830261.1 two-component system OmpR family response regulator [Kineosporia succinea]
MTRSVLVVEDEPSVLELLTRTLSFAGFTVHGASNVQTAREVAARTPTAVAVLDVMLPDGSGLDLAHELREENAGVGVLFLTARDSLEDRLTGFAFGADDYLVKPFSVAEVVARVIALHRRVSLAAPPAGSRPEPAAENVLVVDDVVMDEALYTVTRAGRPLDLSPTEYKLLRYLMVNVDVVVSKEQIVDSVWRYNYVGDVGVVEKFVSQLRRKLGGPSGSFIRTVRGFGYTVRSVPGDA